jgi:hypothetical protein
MGHAACQSFVPLDATGVSAFSSNMTAFLRRLATTCFALLCACGLSSCLDQYSEEMVIHSDLSGEATVTVILPDTLLEKYDAVQKEFSEANLRKRFDKASGVKLTSYSISEGRHPEVRLEVSFSSLEKLSEAAKANPPAQMLIGQFTISKDGKYTVVERKLGLGTATMSLPTDKNAVYKMHFDMPVEVAHTNSGFFDKSHGDVRYRWSLADLASQQPVLINRVLKPLPWLWIAVSVAGLIVLAWIIWQQLANMARKKHLAAMNEPPPAAVPAAPPPVMPAPGEGPVLPPRPGPPQRPGPPRRPGPPGR